MSIQSNRLLVQISYFHWSISGWAQVFDIFKSMPDTSKYAFTRAHKAVTAFCFNRPAQSITVETIQHTSSSTRLLLCAAILKVPCDASKRTNCRKTGGLFFCPYISRSRGYRYPKGGFSYAPTSHMIALLENNANLPVVATPGQDYCRKRKALPPPLSSSATPRSMITLLQVEI